MADGKLYEVTTTKVTRCLDGKIIYEIKPEIVQKRVFLKIRDEKPVYMDDYEKIYDKKNVKGKAGGYYVETVETVYPNGSGVTLGRNAFVFSLGARSKLVTLSGYDRTGWKRNIKCIVDVSYNRKYKCTYSNENNKDREFTFDDTSIEFKDDEVKKLVKKLFECEGIVKSCYFELEQGFSNVNKDKTSQPGEKNSQQYEPFSDTFDLQW